MNNPGNDYPLDVIHNSAANRFEIPLGESLAVLEYEIRNQDLIFLHTLTPIEYEGRGIGSRLARAGLAFAQEHSYHVVPLCSFIAAYIERHPEYASLLQK